MNRFISEQNVQQYERMLVRETDDRKRKVIEGLLLQEKRKLIELESQGK